FPSYKGFPKYKLEFSHAVEKALNYRKTEEFPNSLAELIQDDFTNKIFKDVTARVA
ncbi:hypothetical protein L9F63_017020, partial [Diploptera punctata]